jgi:DNA-binding response OmpR family regulator
MRLLLIESHQPSLCSIQRGLEEAGFAVDVARDGEEGNRKAQAGNYEVIILDIELAKIDGLTLLRTWRRSGVAAHVLVLTSRGKIADKVRGLDLGADDYLTKPFEWEELLARVRALLRRSRQIKDTVLRIHDLEIDTAARTVKRAGRPVYLTRREYALLLVLANHRDMIVTRSTIMQHLYDEQGKNSSNVLEVFIRGLRAKIDDGFDPPLILTRWGMGYMLRPEAG